MHNCNLCKFRTIYKANLQDHVKNFHSELKKTFLCALQFQDHIYERNLKSHTKIHSDQSKDDAVYKCDECEYFSSYKRNLTKHKKDKHTVNTS